MPDDPEPALDRRKRRPVFGRAAFVVLCALLFMSYRLMTAPDTPLPSGWNPVMPLSVADPVTPLTRWKLQRALSEPQTCLDALQTGATAQPLPDRVDNPQCGIANQVRLSMVGAAQVAPFETRCQTALRMAMWVTHGVIPAANTHLSLDVAEVRHYSSYSCRQIRTLGGSNNRMSTHATADAIDISGFVLADGTEVSLSKHWTAGGPKAAFLRQVRDTACDWFRLTLGPDFNRLHADHFHLQNTGSGLCR
ncbi:extensin family protein [Roseobacter sp.]|uniref:extensin-like domain-containing protein n=1 Tax=Roseobacter sp. TaxID=1907202 RepID=UPI00329A7124